MIIQNRNKKAVCTKRTKTTCAFVKRRVTNFCVRTKQYEASRSFSFTVGLLAGLK